MIVFDCMKDIFTEGIDLDLIVMESKSARKPDGFIFKKWIFKSSFLISLAYLLMVHLSLASAATITPNLNDDAMTTATTDADDDDNADEDSLRHILVTTFMWMFLPLIVVMVLAIILLLWLSRWCLMHEHHPRTQRCLDVCTRLCENSYPYIPYYFQFETETAERVQLNGRANAVTVVSNGHAGTVTVGNGHAGTVTVSDDGAGTVTVGNGHAGTVTVGDGRAGTVNVGNGHAGTVTVDKGQAGTLTVGNGHAGTVTVGNGHPGTVTL